MNNKTLYINESVLEGDFLKNEINLEKLPSEYYSLYEKRKMLFCKNDAFPEIYDKPFIINLLEKRYKDSFQKLSSLKETNSNNISDLENILSKIIMKIKSIEKGYEEKLEKLCLNYVIDLFNVPEDCIDFSIDLVDSVESSKEILRLNAEESNFEYSDMKDAESINKIINQRKIINALISGAAEYYSETFDFSSNDIKNINSDINDLYNKFKIIDNFLLIANPKIEQTEENKKEIGMVSVTLGNDIYKSLIESEGIIFPILIYETIKGLIELFSTHGLPQDSKLANTIIKKTDFVKAEVWYMRIGRILWDKFLKSMEEIDDKKIPYIFMNISQLSPYKFNYLMKEIFAETKKSKKMMKKIIENIDYTAFAEKMQKRSIEKNIIEDEFIHPDEI